MCSKKRIILYIIGFLLISILFLNFLYLKMAYPKDDKKTSIKIGVSIYYQYDTFISSLIEYLKQIAKDKEQEEGITITLDIVNAGQNQVTQNYQVENYINQDYDIICVNLVDRTDASVTIDMAMNADIPIIFFNRELVEKDLKRWDKLFYVGAVALESGIMQGQIVIDACENDFDAIDKNKDGTLQYFMLEGEPGHQDSLIRTEYVINTITEAGIQVEKIGDDIANWNRAQGESRITQWLKNNENDIEIIIANNDDMALGAIDALKKEEIVNPPLVVGIDGTKVGLEAVKDGDMIGTVLNDAKGQAKGIIELACQLVYGTPLSEDTILLDGKYIRKPHIIITQDNVEEVLNIK